MVPGPKQGEFRHYVTPSGTRVKGRAAEVYSGQYDPAAEVRRGESAMRRMLDERAGEIAAMSRQGVGDVVFLWGKPGRLNAKGRLVEGEGVAHLVAQRNLEGRDGEAVAMAMPRAIAYGTVTEGQAKGTPGERLRIQHEWYTAVLSLFRYGERQAWLLAGRENEDGGSGVNPAAAYTPGSSGISGQVGASVREATPPGPGSQSQHRTAEQAAASAVRWQSCRSSAPLTECHQWCNLFLAR